MHNNSRYHPPGLTNLGNTCFLNACVQSLHATPEISSILKNNSHKQPKKLKITKEWINLTDSMSIHAGSVITPTKFIHTVHHVAKKKDKDLFAEWDQNDISEFLLFIVECMHESISRKVDIRISGNIASGVDDLAVKCYTMIKDRYSSDYSEILDLFYGIYLSELASMDGTIRHSILPEYFFILDLPIPNKNNTVSNTPISIYDCIDAFIQPEIMDGQNAWFNENTNTKESAKKQVRFWNFPKILVVTFKRFSPDGKHKMTNMIDFPVDNLDLSKYVTGYNALSFMYDLYAVCYHFGNMRGGHYTSCVKKVHPVGGIQWVYCDDERVQTIPDPKYIVTPDAYCLFYRKK
jgi:ubiquitin carboxyl-terminal hydrolase 8